MINLEEIKKQAEMTLDRTRREYMLTLIAEIERLRQKADELYKAARAIADQIAESEAFGAEPNEDGIVEVDLHKGEIDKFIAVVYNWDK